MADLGFYIFGETAQMFCLARRGFRNALLKAIHRLRIIKQPFFLQGNFHVWLQYDPAFTINLDFKTADAVRQLAKRNAAFCVGSEMVRFNMHQDIIA